MEALTTPKKAVTVSIIAILLELPSQGDETANRPAQSKKNLSPFRLSGRVRIFGNWPRRRRRVFG
jgi:hypothetical protein